MTAQTITPVLLCGGSGTRLWPLSRKSYPKQFALEIDGRSLFQASALRLSGDAQGIGFTRPLVVTGSDFRFVVTEHGVAVNPRRADLASRLKEAGLPVRDVHDLKTLAEKMAGVPVAPTFDGRIVGLVEYRDGTVIDVVRQTGG